MTSKIQESPQMDSYFFMMILDVIPSQDNPI